MAASTWPPAASRESGRFGRGPREPISLTLVAIATAAGLVSPPGPPGAFPPPAGSVDGAMSSATAGMMITAVDSTSVALPKSSGVPTITYDSTVADEVKGGAGA